MWLTLLTAAAAGPVLPTLTPTAGSATVLGPAADADHVRCQALYREPEPDAEEQAFLASRCNEVLEGPWDTEGGGCSWYCGGGPELVVATSQLAPQGGYTYGAGRAHDHDLRTAWVEGVDGVGIGQALTYPFAHRGPRVTTLRVVNGYARSEEAWKANGRVQVLRLVVNGEPMALLALQDVRTEQVFTVEPLGRRADGQDLILRFEIVEAKAGERHDDVAITELSFSGIDVH
jgi:hypothetical protein